VKIEELDLLSPPSFRKGTVKKGKAELTKALPSGGQAEKGKTE
jgi:hypothetical protein